MKKYEAKKPEACRECGKNQKANGSSRCFDCSRSYKVRQFEEDRLKRRVEKAKAEN